MKAIIIGAGKIGRGFLAQLLTLNDIEIYFAEKSKTLVDKLNEAGKYTAHILGDESKSTVIERYEAFELDDVDKLAKAWKACGLVFTSVGGKNLKAIGMLLAKAFKQIYKDVDVPNITIITCENWKNPGTELEEEILAHLNDEEKIMFEEKTAVTEAVIMRVAVNSTEEQQKNYPLDVWSHDFWELPIDCKRLKTELPDLKYFKYLDEFGRFLDQKLYTNNTSNASVAYYGYLKGFTYTADAANDPEIEKLMDQVYSEVSQMIVKEMGVDAEEQKIFAKKAKDKYQNRAIVDELTRHGADPIRKLGPQDRLVAPARLCLKHDIKPEAISTVMAMAMFFDNQEDESAVQLMKMRTEKGIPYILENVSKLSTEETLYQMVLKKVEFLKKEGLVHES